MSQAVGIYMVKQSKKNDVAKGNRHQIAVANRKLSE